MAEFNEREHRRDAVGKFANKEQSAPEVYLGDTLGAKLAAELNDLLNDGEARARVYALGEDVQRRQARAQATDDPAELAHLAWASCYYGSDDAAMSNTAAPRSLVHAIATDAYRGRSQTARVRAVTHPNMPAESIHELYHRNDQEDYFANSLHASMTVAPNTPGGVVEALFDDHREGAGVHPNFPADRLAAELQNPERAHEVASNPKVSPEQLEKLLTLRFADDDDDEPIFRTAALARAVKNQAATDEFLTRASEDEDPWVAKCAREAIGGRTLRRAHDRQMRGDNEMRAP